MKQWYTQIGGHTFELLCDAAEEERICQELFLTTSPPLSPHMTITMIRGEERPFHSFHVNVEKRRTGTYYERHDFTIYVDSLYKEAFIEYHSELAAKHALMVLYSGLIVEMNWGILLRTAGVVEGEDAYLFAGHSGAGKTTVAKRSSPRKVLSDEALIVQVNRSEIVVYDSPFRDERTHLTGQESYRLNSIQFLNRSTRNERCAVRQADAFLMVMNNVYHWSRDERDMKKIAGMAEQIVQHVPVHQLFFRNDPTFWEVLKR